MVSDRARKFFKGIVPEERMSADLKMVDRVDWDLVSELNEVLWDAFNGRGKYVSSVIKEDLVAEEYYINIEDCYIDWGKEIDKALENINIK